MEERGQSERGVRSGPERKLRPERPHRRTAVDSASVVDGGQGRDYNPGRALPTPLRRPPMQSSAGTSARPPTGALRSRTALGLAVVLIVAFFAALSPSPARAADQLLSQGRPATASSTESASFPASAAVDGNTGTRWSSAFADPQWLQVDLERSSRSPASRSTGKPRTPPATRSRPPPTRPPGPPSTPPRPPPAAPRTSPSPAAAATSACTAPPGPPNGATPSGSSRSTAPAAPPRPTTSGAAPPTSPRPTTPWR